MEIGAKRYFPYPVLWLDERTDYKNGTFHCDINVDYHINGDNVQIEYKFQLLNQEMLSRIDCGEVSYLVHLECPASGYRNVIQSKENTGVLLIPEKRLSGDLQVCTFLVAQTEITDFSNNDYVDEIREIPFFVDHGCILGIAESYKFFIDTQKIDLGYLPSVIYFSKNEDPVARSMEAEYFGKRIVIKLPEETFFQYQRVQKVDKRSTPILHSIFIIPALAFVMSDLKKISALNRELEFSDYNWYRAINQKLSERDYPTIESEDYHDLDVLKVAQEILDNPPYFALEEMNIAWTQNFVEDSE